jgi:hypothetical protein
MKKIILISVALTFLYTACNEVNEIGPLAEQASGAYLPKHYSSDLAVEWNKLQMHLSRTTPGFGVGVAGRAFAYSGLTLYESLVAGMPGYQSVASFMIGDDITSRKGIPAIYFPASANAAMASIIRSMIPNATADGKARIDALEASFHAQFVMEAPAFDLQHSIDYGKRIAASIFEWSKSDGIAEAIAKNSTYVIPTGPGLWERTPPNFAAPVSVFWGDTRTFAPNSAALNQLPPPVGYSEEVGSNFYNMVNEVYTRSLSLTDYDIITSKTWGESAGTFMNALRYIQIAIQLADEAELPLDQAALAFARHNMAVHDAVICAFKTKYTYNLVRPVTYIRNVMGHTTWNTVSGGTPAHPEYPAAHATLGRASSRALESIFGTNYSFTDRTHESLFGARYYNNLEAYSTKSGWSRVLGGIHYVPSVNAGLTQGEGVADLILGLPWRNQQTEF